MRILVTGAAGFIGSHVVDRLVADGHEVVALDRRRPAPDHHNPGATWVQGDLRDSETWLAHARGVDAVSHQASMVGLGVDFEDVRRYVDDNDAATAAGLWALHRMGWRGRLVLASSMVVYGEGHYLCPTDGTVRPGPRDRADLDAGCWDPPCPRCGTPVIWAPIDEEAPLDPRNVYAATKLHQEHLVAAFAREHGLDAVALRYHNVYGPRLPLDTPYAGVAALFRSKLAAGEPPLVFEDGQQTRDFVHVHDVARANAAALTTSAPGRAMEGAHERPADSNASGTANDGRNAPAAQDGEPTGGGGGGLRAYNVASGRPTTVLGLAQALARVLGGPEPEVVGGYRLGDVRHIVASPIRACRELGFEAAVDLETGLATLERVATS